MNSEFGIQNSESNGISQSEQDGFQIFQSVLEHSKCDLISAELTPLFKQQQTASKNKIGGLRNLLRISPQVLQLSRSDEFLSIVEQFSGSTAFPVRAIFFDKNPEANWMVPWHQDLAIAMVERIETPGFTGWSIKDGTLHVHPPREILESMVTVRLHLDDCDASNGALKILPGSHRNGKLGAAEISKWSDDYKSVVCELSKGGVLLMRPLLLHASSPAENPKHRRVLHIEYATQELPNGLKWLNR
jgi:ectoine hydroxylase-related dioxygenase (phytanoyl-CoA dioxygenase family)